MNCEQVKEWLSPYLDNMLAPAERRTVTRHVQSCPHCALLLAELRQNDALLTQLPRAQPSPALHRRLFSHPEIAELARTLPAPSMDQPGHPHSSRLVPRRAGRPHLVFLIRGRSSHTLLEQVSSTPRRISPPGARKHHTCTRPEYPGSEQPR